MKHFVLAITTVFAITAGALAQDAMQSFEGAFFEILYPHGFLAEPGVPSFSSDGVDSAIFTSDDGSVAFYVFAPQWGGVPEDIMLDDATEVLISEQEKQTDGTAHRWWTIAAQDKSYSRSYHQITENEGTTTQIIGVRYASLEALNQHRDAYAAFKKSLTRFAD